MKKLRLLVPLATIVAVLLLLIAPAGALASSEHKPPGLPGCVKWHYVQCGQTLSSIARMYGTSASYLAAINHLANPNVIYAGTSLCVRWAAPPPPPPCGGCGPKPPPPCGGCGPKPPPHPGGFWYFVRCGDTLNKIGARFGWSATYLAQVNHIWNPNVIYAGQRLWIPAH
jgi:LysM repeat protein